jgi:hypothetical protein
MNMADFNGVNSDIEVDDDPLLTFTIGDTVDSPMSISAWISIDDTMDFPIINKQGTGGSEWLFSAGYNTLNFQIYDTSVPANLQIQYTELDGYTNTVIHVCATYDGGSNHTGLSLYLNGTSVGATQGNGAYVRTENTVEDVNIGSWLDTWYSDGQIANIKIFNKELSSAEVLSEYNSQDQTDSLIAFYSLSSDALDTGGNGLNGTESNITYVSKEWNTNGGGRFTVIDSDYLNTNVVDIAWMGAIPDGLTDASIAILNAMRNATTITFPSGGSFMVSDTVELLDKDIYIRGNGASITTGTGSHPVFYRTEHDNYTLIEKLSFSGGGEAFEYTATPSSTQYYEFEIRDCFFLQDSATYAIKLNGAREGKIEDCFFLDNDGIYRTASVNTEIVNCDFKNTTYSVHDDGDETPFSAGLRVIGGYSLGVDSAFVLRGSDYFALVNVMADFCDNPVIIQGQNGGIIDGGYYSSRISAPIILIDTTGTGLSESSQHIKIIGAEIVSNYTAAGDSTTIGISIVDAAHTHIAYNTIHFWTKYGIKDSSSTFTIIDHNRIVPRSGFGESEGGIYSILDNSVNRITENNFDNGFGVTRSNALVYNNSNSGITAAGAATFVSVDSSAFGNPGNIHYGGQSSLTEKWGSTGYILNGIPDTLIFPKPFETAILGLTLTPFRNVDSTAYNWHLVNAFRDTVFIEFMGTDSAIYFYRAIGY